MTNSNSLPGRDRLATPIQYVKGVGPRIAALFDRKGIRTVEDALFFLPRTYEDRRRLKRIAELVPGGRETGLGEVLLSGFVFFPRMRKKIFEAVVGDGSGTITLKWFHGNPRYLSARFRKGQRLLFSGEVKRFQHQKEIHHPDVEPVDGAIEDDSLHFKRIVPVYSEIEGLPQKTLRRLMKAIVDEFAGELSSPIPPDILERQGLIGFTEAFRQIHFPEDGESMEGLSLHRSKAQERIIFDEFFFLELGLALEKRGVEEEQGISFLPEGRLARRLLEGLSFPLTGAQERVWREVRADMARPHPMNRLVQGDVGSGKTVVALLACLNAIECGYQAVVMAPTEVLAEQHHLNLRRLVEPLGVGIALLTSQVKGTEREALHDRIRMGSVPLVIGTHAVIQESIEFERLGLAIVDEQHKFGVVQRGLLRRKGGNPDVLVMTATPIPRTLAMTVYGDLDVSLIDEMPQGRTPTETKAFPESGRERVYRIVADEIRKGRQAFIVYPLVEESEKLDLRDATRMAEHLRSEVFPEYRIGLLHGRMKSDEKESAMAAFKEGRVQILVSTTVIEVGIDIPNASVMVVEHAERFGLSQLHQLRGRIGRGLHPSKCLLLIQARLSEEARRRIRAMERTNDGFQIAEEDLALRGPGEFFGTQQSGFPAFRVAHLLRDAPLLIEARKEAFRLARDDPGFSLPSHGGLRSALTRRWKERLDLGKIG